MSASGASRPSRKVFVSIFSERNGPEISSSESHSVWCWTMDIDVSHIFRRLCLPVWAVFREQPGEIVPPNAFADVYDRQLARQTHRLSSYKIARRASPGRLP